MPKYEPKSSLREAVKEPFEFTFFGKDYCVKRLPIQMASAIQLADRDLSAACEAVLRCMVGNTDYEKAIKGGVDVREILAVVNWIIKNANETMSAPEKNLPEASAESEAGSPASSDTATS